MSALPKRCNGVQNMLETPTLNSERNIARIVIVKQTRKHSNYLIVLGLCRFSNIRISQFYAKDSINSPSRFKGVKARFESEVGFSRNRYYYSRPISDLHKKKVINCKCSSTFTVVTLLHSTL